MRGYNVNSLKIYTNYRDLFDAAAQMIVARLDSALKEKRRVALVLTGGGTPKPLYELLGTAPYRTRLEWDRIHLFWGDERCVLPEDPQSNFGMAWKALICRLEIPQSNIHRIPGEWPDPEEAASFYEQELLRILPERPVPEFDLVLLGMGADGHVASLFPGTEWDQNRLVVANYAPKLHSQRISMTPRLINEAGTILFLVKGAAKAAALACVLRDPECQAPARKITPSHGDMLWMVDRDAASKLE
jgi:6-phosphogluconolactonase